jgi:hypothetical protein
MRKGKVFFHPIDGSAPLTISWSAGPKGDAIEAKKGAGVGFFSDKGDLLCVIFDEVIAAQDCQTLEFPRSIIEIRVKSGRVTYSVSEAKRLAVKRKRRAKRVSTR